MEAVIFAASPAAEETVLFKDPSHRAPIAHAAPSYLQT